ncbi:MAG: hypothetical protein J0M11_17375 [Anaerolineae bacterium]|nr:hypothetical protein [Anaerolineae bacterium]
MNMVIFFVGLIIGLIVGGLALVLIFQQKINVKEKKHQRELEIYGKKNQKAFQNRSFLIRFSDEQLKGIRFRTINEISDFVQTTKLFNDFAKFTVNLLEERFQLSHVALFYVDTDRKFANMVAGTGEGGKRMVERGHKFSLSHTSVIGFCITKNAICIDQFDLSLMGIFYSCISENAQDNIIPDFAFFEVHGFGFGCPDLPETCQRLALPLRINGNIIGALDIHVNNNDIGREGIEILLPIANHIASVGVNFER